MFCQVEMPSPIRSTNGCTPVIGNDLPLKSIPDNSSLYDSQDETTLASTILAAGDFNHLLITWLQDY